MYSLAELSLTGILGQIRVKYRQEFWEMTIKIYLRRYGGNWKVGVEMPCVQSKIHSDYDSAVSIADLDLEDGKLRKMRASPPYVHG